MGSRGNGGGGGLALNPTPVVPPVQQIPQPANYDGPPVNNIDDFRNLSPEDAARYVAAVDREFSQRDYNSIIQQGMNPNNTVQALVDKLNYHDGPMAVLPDAAYDAQYKANALNRVEIYRGLGGDQSKSGDVYQQQFLYGDKTFIGGGVHGDGIYMTTSMHYANMYSGVDATKTSVTGYIDKSVAKVVTEDSIQRQFGNESSQVQRGFGYNYNAYALYKGYNVIHCPGGNRSAAYAYGKGSGRGNNARYMDFYMPLTRSVLVMREHTRLR